LTAAVVGRRGAVAGVRRAGALATTVLAIATGCASGGSGTRSPATTAPPNSFAPGPSSTGTGGTSDRVAVSGDATLDGAPFSALTVGAVVLDSGLVTPCQSTLTPVDQGRYSITVLAEGESSGCGRGGARIALWTFVHGTIVYSTNTVAWPDTGHSVSFAPRYSSSAPAGAVPSTAQFTGSVRQRNGDELPAGTRVDAYVRDTLCATASVRHTSDYTGYVLAVVGPDSVAGCARGQPLTFRINGLPALVTSVRNTPPGQQATLDLTLA
jgi:hypothetical protein